MSRKDINSLWEDNKKRLHFLDTNEINKANSKNTLPVKVYESIARDDNLHIILKDIHDDIFKYFLIKYNLLGNQYKTEEEFDIGENYERYVLGEENYEAEIDFEYTELIDLILEDKKAMETIDEYKKRILDGDIVSINDENDGVEVGIVKIIKELINFKILLYMLCHVNETEDKYVKMGEFQLEDFSMIMSGNEDLYLKPRNIEVIHKINTLFINNMKLNKFYDLCNLYFNHLDKDLRAFNIRQENVILKALSSEGVINETERIINIISINEDSVPIREWNICKTVFERVLNDPWYYEYKPNISSNIVKPEHMEEKFLPQNKNKDSIKEQYKSARKIEDIFSEESIKSGHTWEVTEAIEFHKQRKKSNPLREKNGFIEIDIEKSSKSLDRKYIKNAYEEKAIWSDIRSKATIVNKINYKLKNSNDYLTPVNVLNLDNIENILGLLGSGKSTFSMIAANDIIDKGGVVVFLVDSIESGLNLASEFQKIDVKVTMLKGDSNSEDKLISVMKNKLKKENIFSLFEKERENIRLLDPTSQSKAELSRIFKQNEKGRTSDTILIKGKNGKFSSYINPEVKDSAIHFKLRNLKEAQVIIVNYSAYVNTKIPASLDIYERDLFTALHLISDIIIVDEVDLAQSKFTEEYVSDISIASSVPEGKYTNNYLEIIMPYKNKVNRDSVFLKSVWDQSQVASNLFNMQTYFYYKEILNKPFNIYSMITDIFERYINIDDRTIYRMGSFHRFERLAEKVPRTIPDKKPRYKYEELFYTIIIDMGECTFDHKTKKRQIRKRLARFINMFLKEENLKPKQSLYINPKMIVEDEEIEETLEFFDIEKYINGEEISDGAFTRLLFLFEFCVFNKNQIYLNNETIGFLLRNNSTDEIPNELGRLPIRPNPGIYPYAPKALVKNSNSYTLTRNMDSEKSLKIKMKEYKLIGERVLTESNKFYEGIEDTPMPSIIMMSATSYIPTSSMYHNKHHPNYLIRNSQQTDMKINCRFIPIYDGEGLAFVSTNNKWKKRALKSMIRELTKDGGLFDQQLGKAQLEYENEKAICEKKGDIYNGRKRIIGIPVTSFELVYIIKELLNETKYGNKTIAQYRAGDEDKDQYRVFFKDVNLDEYISKENVNELYKEDCDVFIFVMNSVGRGYNMLQSDTSFKSLIGSEFFLVRPYLMAEDFADAIYTLHSMQSGIINKSYQKYILNDYAPVSEIYKNIIGLCHAEYTKLVGRNIKWSKLDKQERLAIASNYLVLLYQTIGRGLRGGTDLDVFFVDAAFIGEDTVQEILKKGVDADYNYEPQDEENSSFLSIFESISNTDDYLIQELYSKLGEGLKGIAIKQK